MDSCRIIIYKGSSIARSKKNGERNMLVNRSLSVCLAIMIVIGFVPMIVFAMEPIPEMGSKPTEPNGIRTVVIETFTATWAGPCTYETQALHQLAGEYTSGQLAIAEWHTADNWEPIDGSKTERYNYYGVTGIPTVLFDGGKKVVGASSKQNAYDAYKPMIDTELGIPGEVTITQASNITGSTVNIEASINAEQKSGTFTARILLLENVEIVDNNHNVDWVIWRQLLLQSITLTAGQTTTITASGAINSGWDQNKLYTIAFVQDDSNQVILNGNLTKLGSGGGGNDTQAPQISNVQHSPAAPTDQDQVTVTATITDNVGVASATLFYDDGSGSKSTPMSGSGSTYTAKMGPFATGKTVTYYVEAKDAAKNAGKSQSGSFTVTTGGDKQAPQISNLQHSPSVPKDTDQVTVSATITDNVGVASAILYYDDGNGWKNMTMTGTGSSYSARIGPFSAGMKVNYYVEAKDAAGNTNWSQQASFSVIASGDSTPPTITNVQHIPNSPKDTDQVIITATITDNVGVSSAMIYYSDGSGTQNKTMTNTGSSYFIILGSFGAGKTVIYYIEAKDAKGNSAKSPTASFIVQSGSADTENPVIKNVAHSPTNPTSNNNVIVTATITDNVGVASAEVKYNDGSGETILPMTNVGTSYSANMGKFAEGTTIIYHVEAKDTAGNLAKSTNGSFTVNAVGQAPDVAITDLKISPAEPKTGETITITATIKNIGIGDAFNIKVTFYIGETKICEKTVTSLASNAMSTVSTTWISQTTGAHDLRVEATTAGDADTSNDIMTISFLVSTTSNTSVMLTGLLIMSIIVAILIAVMMVVILRRRDKSECPECGTLISTKSNICSNCGYDFIRKSKLPLTLSKNKEKYALSNEERYGPQERIRRQPNFEDNIKKEPPVKKGGSKPLKKQSESGEQRRRALENIRRRRELRYNK
jgi:hypothetical protein